MKRLLVIAFTLLSLSLSAQENHLTFNGISISGPLTSFVSALKSQGYVSLNKTERGCVLRGSFAEAKDCCIIVSASPKTLTTGSVTVFMPETSTWASVKSDYKELCSAFRNKYGRPTKELHYFKEPFEDGGGSEIYAMNNHYANFLCKWEKPNGKIFCGIFGCDGEVQIAIFYIDSKGKELKEKEEADNLIEEVESGEIDDDLEIHEAEDESKGTVVDVTDFDYFDSEDTGEQEMFQIVENMPSFPGGSPTAWVNKNLQYPVLAKENDISGKVYVQFVIEKDGSITNVKVARGVEASLDKEAVRVVSMMPKWKPGKQRGKPVRVAYTLPINFQLPNN